MDYKCNNGRLLVVRPPLPRFNPDFSKSRRKIANPDFWKYKSRITDVSMLELMHPEQTNSPLVHLLGRLKIEITIPNLRLLSKRRIFIS
jgi:hypothetical protein